MPFENWSSEDYITCIRACPKCDSTVWGKKGDICDKCKGLDINRILSGLVQDVPEAQDLWEARMKRFFKNPKDAESVINKARKKNEM